MILETILLIIAIIPAIFLMRLIYKADTIEKEPLPILVMLAIGGAVIAAPVVVVELLLDELLGLCFGWFGFLYILLSNFIGVALVEELGKFIVTLFMWKSKHFKHLFDGIVYAVFASLGFALLENVLYVIGEGSFLESVELGILRGFLSVPLHCFCGVFMGYYYGLAKQNSLAGNKAKSKNMLIKSLLVPTLIHGFYDFCLSFNSFLLTIVFFIFVIILYIVAFRRIKKSSKSDKELNEASRDFTHPIYDQNYKAGNNNGYETQYRPRAYNTDNDIVYPGDLIYNKEAWICSCGHANRTAFCTQCGRQKH